MSIIISINFKKMAVCMLMGMLSVKLLCGCGPDKEKVTLSMWGSKEDQEMLGEMVAAFKEEYKDEADFDITISEENEVTCKLTVLINPKEAADIYIYIC